MDLCAGSVRERARDRTPGKTLQQLDRSVCAVGVEGDLSSWMISAHRQQPEMMEAAYLPGYPPQ